MALQMNVTLESGLTVNNAYVRVDTVSGYKGELRISLNDYLSKQHFDDGMSYIRQRIFTFIPSVEDGSPNFIKQGYEHLKTLEEFENTTDS